MPKVALCYTGNLRTWERCKHNHKENIWSNDTELFFYTYENPFDDFLNTSGLSSHWKQIVEPFYPNPFGYHKYSERKAPENQVFNTMNQWINNFIGFRLIPKGYDIYVRIRPDLNFNGKLDFSQYPCSDEGNVIYIPQGMDFGGINDQFAFGGYEAMKTYYSVLFNCHDLWDEGTIFHSESMQLANLNKRGIQIVRIGSPQHDIVR